MSNVLATFDVFHRNRYAKRRRELNHSGPGMQDAVPTPIAECAERPVRNAKHFFFRFGRCSSALSSRGRVESFTSPTIGEWKWALNRLAQVFCYARLF